MDKDLIEWYISFSQSYSNFVYSFEFLSGVLGELVNRSKIWQSSEMYCRIQQWKSIIDELILLKIEIKKVIPVNVKMDIGDWTNVDLVNIKCKLVEWIGEDMAKLYQENIIRFTEKDSYGNVRNMVKIYDGNVKRPYILSGQDRDVMEYRVSLNRKYLDLVCNYFIKFIKLDELIIGRPLALGDSISSDSISSDSISGDTELFVKQNGFLKFTGSEIPQSIPYQ